MRKDMNLIKARQDVRLARESIRLQDLRVREAEDGVTLAGLQLEKAEIQEEHFDGLLHEGLIRQEQAAIALMLDTFALLLQASGAEGVKAALTFGLTAGNALEKAAQATSSLASLYQFLANHERQKEDWTLQRDLAAQDIRIGTQQIRLAQDHVRIVGQERNIAGLQAEHSEEVAEFLANKFASADLYEWMSGDWKASTVSSCSRRRHPRDWPKTSSPSSGSR